MTPAPDASRLAVFPEDGGEYDGPEDGPGVRGMAVDRPTKLGPHSSEAECMGYAKAPSGVHQVARPGCSICNHPLYAGVKCPNCGRTDGVFGTREARYREALERIADPRNIHFAGDAQVVARDALGVNPSELPGRSRWLWTHIVKGGDYRMLGEAKLQTDKPLSDMAEVVVYQGADGRLWAREKHEFEARFSRTRPDGWTGPWPAPEGNAGVGAPSAEADQQGNGEERASHD